MTPGQLPLKKQRLLTLLDFIHRTKNQVCHDMAQKILKAKDWNLVQALGVAEEMGYPVVMVAGSSVSEATSPSDITGKCFAVCTASLQRETRAYPSVYSLSTKDISVCPGGTPE